MCVWESEKREEESAQEGGREEGRKRRKERLRGGDGEGGLRGGRGMEGKKRGAEERSIIINYNYNYD